MIIPPIIEINGRKIVLIANEAEVLRDLSIPKNNINNEKTNIVAVIVSNML